MQRYQVTWCQSEAELESHLNYVNELVDGYTRIVNIVWRPAIPGPGTFTQRNAGYSIVWELIRRVNPT